MKGFLVSVPTVYETLELVAALLDEGVIPEDLSVVLDESFSDHLSDSSPTPSRSVLGEDLTADRSRGDSLNYARTHNEEMEPAGEASRSQTRPIYESEVGGGVSTSSTRDSVSAVEEMDESNEIAEELLHPQGARDVRTHGPRSFSELDAEDVAGRVDVQGDTSAIHGYESGQAVGVLAALIPAVVPGLGVVMGDGDLASTLLGEEDEAMEQGLAPYLTRKGVSQAAAVRFESVVSDGGGLVEVAAASGEASARQVRRILETVPQNRVIPIDIL